MKKTNRVLVLLVLFGFLGCASDTGNRGQETAMPLTDLSHIYRPPSERRFVEETGGFSLMIPKDWQATAFPGSRFQAIWGPEENGFTPYILFSVDTFDGTLELMIDNLIQDWGIMLEGFMVLQRSDFNTLHNLSGERLITNTATHGQRLRHVSYILPGEGASSILAMFTVQAEAGDLFDERFDSIARTFEWMPALQEENRHFEEAGGFSIIIPESWEAVEMPYSEFKVLRGRDQNGFIAVLFFTLVPFGGQLTDLVDTTFNGWNEQSGNTLLLAYRGGFVTLENLEGEKLIFHEEMSEPPERLIAYFLPGKNSNVIVAVYVIDLQADNILDEKVNRAMKTFEWMSN